MSAPKVVLTVKSDGELFYLSTEAVPGLHVCGKSLWSVLHDALPIWKKLYEVAPAKQGVPKPDSQLPEKSLPKRYDIWAQDIYEECSLEVEQNNDGAWVKWEDIASLFATGEKA